MIRGSHGALRTAETDDAPAFMQLYQPQQPRAALLTRLREVIAPTVDEITEVLRQSEKTIGPFYAIEDSEGRVRGFCALRSGQHVRDAAFYAELVVLFSDTADYGTPLSDEIYDLLYEWAFVERQYNKIIVHCLDCETAFRGWILSKGFESNGLQRDVLFTQGRWHSVETMSLHAPVAAAVTGK